MLVGFGIPESSRNPRAIHATTPEPAHQSMLQGHISEQQSESEHCGCSVHSSGAIRPTAIRPNGSCHATAQATLRSSRSVSPSHPAQRTCGASSQVNAPAIQSAVSASRTETVAPHGHRPRGYPCYPLDHVAVLTWIRK